MICLDNNEDMIRITRIKESEGRRLIPYGEYGVRLSEETRKSLFAEMERLLDDHYAILAVTEGKNLWYIIEGEERVIFSQCELAYLPDNAKPAYRKRVLEALDLRKRTKRGWTDDPSSLNCDALLSVLFS